MIEIKREIDATRINEILNDPSVRPWVDDKEGPLDIQFQLNNLLNILLMGEHGGILFLYVMPGVYEAHTQVLPSGRGKWTDELTHACIHWMFSKSDCYELITRVPKPHIRARTAAVRSGGKYEFTRPDGCLFRGSVVPVDIFTIRIQDWCISGSFLEPIGEWFHQRLNQEALKSGIKDSPHENDTNHNKVVGACFAMFEGGQVMKAINIYNRWAIIARHPTISLISSNPPTIKMDIGILRMNNNDIELI